MASIVDAEAYAFAKNYSGSGDWLDEANSHDGAITGATWVDNSGDSYFDFTTNDVITLSDAANLDFAAADSFTIGLAIHCADYSTGATQGVIIKRTGSASGWLMAINGSGTARCEIEDTSGNNPEDTISGFSDNTKHTLIGVRNVGDDDIEVFIDGVGSGSPTTDTTTATLANAVDVSLGGPSGGASLIGRIYSYAIIRQALSDADVAVLHSQLYNQASDATVTPTTIVTTTTMPTPTVGIGVSPASITTTTTMPAPALTYGTTVSPASIATTTTMPAPTVLSVNTVTPATIVTTTTMPAPAHIGLPLPTAEFKLLANQRGRFYLAANLTGAMNLLANQRGRFPLASE